MSKPGRSNEDQFDPGPDETPSLFAETPDFEALEREVERIREAEAAATEERQRRQADERAEKAARYRAESPKHHAESVRVGNQRLAEARAKAAAAQPDTPATAKRRTPGAKRKRKRKQNAPPKPAEDLTLGTATTPDELVLAAAADYGYTRPAPSWQELIRWWRKHSTRNPIDAELVKALRAVLGKYAALLPWIASDGGAEDFRAVVPGTDKPLDIMECHRRWLDLPEHPRHLVSVMVESWDRLAPRRVGRDLRSSAIIPHSLRDADRNQGVLPLGLDRTTPLGPIQEYEQGYLPGLEPPTSLVPPVPWLTLYDLTGVGPVQTRGRGAPLAQRLFVEVLTAVLIGDRDPEWSTAPPVTLRDLFEWLWPRYYDRTADRMRGGYDRSKHLEPLRRALVELDNMRILYDRYERRLIRVDDLPTAATALDDPIRFHVRYPPNGDHGPMIERAGARRWGVVSAPAWRSTIRLAYLWDDAKHRNNGARVYATRPVVARGSGGALLGTDGKPLRDRHGAMVTDWSDRRAVILGADGRPTSDSNPPTYERNPAADRVPELGPDDLILLAFDKNLDTNRYKRLLLAREALRAKEAAGEVVIEAAGEGWRIIEAWQR
ncbi:MAG: hypothetical protein OXQ31_05035 [Spirochaetaceae bacterium]|nr:hypothetical protein [Spirochaetaceae bacterium]MDE0363764.1 hypothetical protein [Rhodospirillaceae bacterium]